jgi:tetratricopeptide (TPR) repeat protein
MLRPLLLFVYLLMSILFIACSNQQNKAYKPYQEILKNEAFDNINDSIANNKNNSHYYAYRSAVASQIDQPDLAWLDATTAWGLNNNNEAANAITNVIINHPYKEVFTSYMQAVVNTFPNNIKMRRALQLIYFNKKEFKNALLQNDTIFMQFNGEPVPNIDYFLQDRGKLYLELGDSAKAIKNFEQAIHTNPLNEDALFELANIYANTANPNVISLCDAFIKNDIKQQAEPYYYKAVYYNTINNNTEALRQIDLAIKTNYSLIDPWLLSGDIYFSQNNLAKAEEAFNKAITLSKTNADAWYGLGQIAEKKNDKANAYLFYGRAFGFDDTFTQAKEGMERNK